MAYGTQGLHPAMSAVDGVTTAFTALANIAAGSTGGTLWSVATAVDLPPLRRGMTGPLDPVSSTNVAAVMEDFTAYINVSGSKAEQARSSSRRPGAIYMSSAGCLHVVTVQST